MEKTGGFLRRPSHNSRLRTRPPHSSTIHPSRNWMIRFPYSAFVSECVTWMMVVPRR